jgi:hypothetical protein
MIEGISICCSPDLKIAPGQMVRMFKSTRSREVFRGNRRSRKRCGAESVGHTAKYEDVRGEEMTGCPRVCASQLQEELRPLTLF